MDSTVSGAILPEMLNKAVTSTVSLALEEDIGSGDLTAKLLRSEQQAIATIISREKAVLCGIPWVNECFRQLDASILIDWKASEGDHIAAAQTLCEIRGSARAMLTAERCALNFLQSLSATATITRRYVDAIEGTKAQIFDTRKTLPGLRLAQKYAVTIGGGKNHRLGLHDGILVKENHIAAAGSIEAALHAAQKMVENHQVPIQIEVESLSQLQTALDCGAKLILLDNFNLQALRDAVKLNNGRAVLEASGGIGLENVREIAITGVDRISIGSITKNLKAIDLSMRFRAQP
ncbi:MAG TPA: carboxylating nicotinate-nucleotide diphosphorylase [Methylophilaceae bacterium]|nr:carboxylating nicotinate-nucleotide diphosphorylase [Methylophilaceae bacterium]